MTLFRINSRSSVASYDVCVAPCTTEHCLPVYTGGLAGGYTSQTAVYHGIPRKQDSYSTNDGIKLGQRHRRWFNIKPTLCQCLTLAEMQLPEGLPRVTQLTFTDTNLSRSNLAKRGVCTAIVEVQCWFNTGPPSSTSAHHLTSTK